jgi:cyclic pyranopterin phosphate synthase
MNRNFIKNPNNKKILIDSYGRTINYLRVSVTDRCNYRCTYCMPEKMKFLPKKDLLTLDEMDYLCSLFISRGIKNIRLSGGEPLVRKGIIKFISNLSRFIKARKTFTIQVLGGSMFRLIALMKKNLMK